MHSDLLRNGLEQIAAMRGGSWKSLSDAVTAAERTLKLVADEPNLICTGCNQDVEPCWSYCPWCGAQGRASLQPQK